MRPISVLYRNFHKHFRRVYASKTMLIHGGAEGPLNDRVRFLSDCFPSPRGVIHVAPGEKHSPGGKIEIHRRR